MTTDELITLICDDLGLPLAEEDLGSDLDTVIAWDSLQMLRLATAVEARTGRPTRLAALLECRTLADVLTTLDGGRETLDPMPALESYTDSPDQRCTRMTVQLDPRRRQEGQQ